MFQLRDRFNEDKNWLEDNGITNGRSTARMGLERATVMAREAQRNTDHMLGRLEAGFEAQQKLIEKSAEDRDKIFDRLEGKINHVIDNLHDLPPSPLCGTRHAELLSRIDAISQAPPPPSNKGNWIVGILTGLTVAAVAAKEFMTATGFTGPHK
jgi:hypothetical protein